MTTSHPPGFRLNRPGALIAALPAVLGFVPEKSLVLVAIDRGELGCVMRVDLSPDLAGVVEQLADAAAGALPDTAIAVIIDEDGAGCPTCHDDFRRLAAALTEALDGYDITLMAVHVVDRVAADGRWHCVDECGSAGAVDDPSASPMALAAVLDGRRLYGRRTDLKEIIATDEAVAGRLDELLGRRPAGNVDRPAGEVRDDIAEAITAADRVATTADALSDAELARLARMVTDVQVRDTLYALAVGGKARQAELLWVVLSRSLPSRWRVEPLVLLAFSAYARGDGPLAGIALEAALDCDPRHRMATMLDTALQSGMRPEQIRDLAVTGYRLAESLGVQLPPRRAFRRMAG